MIRASFFAVGLSISFAAAMDAGATGQEMLHLGRAKPGEETGRAGDEEAVVQSWLKRFGSLGNLPGAALPPTAASSSGDGTSDHRRLQGAHSTPKILGPI